MLSCNLHVAFLFSNAFPIAPTRWISQVKWRVPKILNQWQASNDDSHIGSPSDSRIGRKAGERAMGNVKHLHPLGETAYFHSFPMNDNQLSCFDPESRRSREMLNR
jgi:hypothetical protein